MTIAQKISNIIQSMGLPGIIIPTDYQIHMSTDSWVQIVQTRHDGKIPSSSVVPSDHPAPLLVGIVGYFEGITVVEVPHLPRETFFFVRVYDKGKSAPVILSSVEEYQAAEVMEA